MSASLLEHFSDLDDPRIGISLYTTHAIPSSVAI